MEGAPALLHKDKMAAAGPARRVGLCEGLREAAPDLQRHGAPAGVGGRHQLPKPEVFVFF